MLKSISAFGTRRDRNTAYGPPMLPLQPSGSVRVIRFGNGLAARYVPGVRRAGASPGGMTSGDGEALGVGVGVASMAPGPDGPSPIATTATSAKTACAEAAMRRVGVMNGNLDAGHGARRWRVRPIVA